MFCKIKVRDINFCRINGSGRFFTIVIYCFRDGNIDLELDVVYEGIMIFRLLDEYNEGIEGYATGLAMFNCNAGNRVWVRAFGPGSVKGSDQYSLFTIISLTW